MKGGSQTRKFGFICISLFAILSVPFIAVAAESDTLGIYVGVLGGVAIPFEMNTIITDNTAARGWETNTSLDIGWLAGVKLGYLTPFTNRILAAELEYNHIENGFDSGKTYQLSGYPVNFNSTVRVDAVMFNLIGRYPEGKLHPYVGAGAGYASLQIDEIKASIAGTNVGNASSGSATVFAFQFLAGLNVDITKNWFAGLGYKLFHTDRASYDMSLTSPFGTGRDVGFIDAPYQSHNIVVTIGYLF
jgi:opacity protein-like surface antigen